MINILLILLGCNISFLLNDRITTAVQFVRNMNTTVEPAQIQVDWFLSGGVKFGGDGESESSKMKKVLMAEDVTTHSWHYIEDPVATNTAENFIMADTYLKSTSKVYTTVYIITSRFHYQRADKIASRILVDYSHQVKWILGDAELPDSRYWESMHIQNVEDDVSKAMHKFRMVGV